MKPDTNSVAAEQSSAANLAASQLSALRRDLDHERAFIHTILESIGSALLIADSGGKVVRANSVAHRLLAVGEEDLVGESLWVRIGAPTLTFDSLVEPRRFESYIQRREVRRHVSWQISHAVEEGLDYIIASGLDVTDRDEMLERMQRSDRMASLGTLAAGVAHEVNNPLTWVLANLRMLQDKLEGADLELVDECLEGADRIRRIVGELMTFQRQDGKNVARSNPREAVQAALSLLKLQLRHDSRIVEDLRDTPDVGLDRWKLGQVLVNLVTNAFHAVERVGGDAVVRVTTRTSADGGAAIIEVADSGPGISPDQRAAIFDPFFTSKPHVGTGLGLFVSAQIVETIGGSIDVKRAQEGGALFQVRMPAYRGEQRARSLTPARPKLRVLIVDDEAGLLRAINRLLADYDTTTAQSGQRALELLLEQRFDVVLCDLMMPEIDGRELFERVAREKPEMAKRFVFMTGGAVTDRVRDFVERLVNPLLPKPFEMSEMREIFERVASSA
ncbi:MAG: response regulator [Myxococcales bacterium]|nr:response regulator [Myxococcales bacterium]